MMRARQYLSQLKRSATRFLSRSSPDRLDLHQTAFLARFATAEGKLNRAAVAYFTKALSVAGFLSVEEIPQVITDYSQKAAWRAALLDEAEGLCRVGLPVYASLAGPLDGGLDWSNLPRDAKDRLYQLRPHRFGFLPRLAIAASCGAEALPPLLATLERWIAHVDKHAAADAHHSNLVVIYRLLAVSWAAPFCAAMARDGDNTAAAICLRLFQILAADIQYLRPRLGDSAANNHLLADRFAAWFLATCYPELRPQSDSHGLERSWQDELCRQFHSDGTSFEQSIHYHEIGCELAAAYLVISLRCGRHVQESILMRIGSMLRFQAVLADHRGNTFALGDSTDDPLLPLDAGAGWGGGAWRILYRALFDSSFPATGDEARGAERAFWLLAALSGIQQPLPRPSPRPASAGDLVAFPDGGYVAFRDERREQLVLFRTGPRQGVEVYPGHAMSDLLSVYWKVAGQSAIEPSGTYSYAAVTRQGEGPSFPRDYFRGPGASNGIILAGHDPLGSPRGRFRDSDNGTRVTTQWRSLDGALGWAEGKLDEHGPMNGYRRGVLHLAGRYTLVYDRLPPLPKDATVSCRWQLAPEAKVGMQGARQASIGLDGRSIFLCAGGDLAVMNCLQGQADPPAGWVSRSYGTLQAAPQLIASVGSGAQDLAFVFGIAEEREESPMVEVLVAKQDGLLLEVKLDGDLGIACIGDVSAGRNILPFDLEFRGRVLWLGVAGESCREIRALGLKRLRSSALGLDLVAESAAWPTHGTWRLAKHQAEIDGISGRWEYSSAG